MDIDKFNMANNIDKSLNVNGRNMTNLGLFRKYIQKYIETHPGVNKDMHLLVRHLQPTEKGIPLEIYCFSKDKNGKITNILWLTFLTILSLLFLILI